MSEKVINDDILRNSNSKASKRMKDIAKENHIF
jgi:hypothetical protein